MPRPKRSTSIERRRHPPSELQDALLSTDVLDSFIRKLVVIAAAVIGEDSSAAVTVIREGRRALSARSDELADSYDGIVQGPGEGPAMTALTTGRVVVIEDIATDERFAQIDRSDRAAGWRSALFLPLDIGEETVGVLSLHACRAHMFGAAQQVTATRFSWEASRALNLAVRRARDLEVTDQLRQALVSRAVIDQGIGIIMGQNRCNAATAFGMLRSASQHRNVKLRTVSAEIVTAVSNGPPTPPSSFVQ
ncbi:MAG: GAF and ANTAR domain-containing protein [Cellulomonas sp.]